MLELEIVPNLTMFVYFTIQEVAKKKTQITPLLDFQRRFGACQTTLGRMGDPLSNPREPLPTSLPLPHRKYAEAERVTQEDDGHMAGLPIG